MTRINLLPVEQLTDQHLIAEYREMLMIPAALKRTLSSKKGLNINSIPSRYVLGTNHIKFFYNKGKFLDKRYSKLCNEIDRRGFNRDKTRILPIQIFKDNNLYLNWTPSLDELEISYQRISERIAMKPQWYRKTQC